MIDQYILLKNGRYVVRQNIKKNGGDGLNLTAIPMHVS